MRKNYLCPICKSMVTMAKIYPYDGYMRETPYYFVGCANCQVGAKDIIKEKACEKWEKLAEGNK